MERWKEIFEGVSEEDSFVFRTVGMVQHIEMMLNSLGWYDEEIKKSDLKRSLEEERDKLQKWLEEQKR